MAVAKDSLSQYKNWHRIVLLLEYGSREVCCDVLFRKENWPTDGAELFKRLKPLQSKICRFRDQQEILCPSTGTTDHNKFDGVLFTAIIKVLFGSKYQSLVNDLRAARNSQYHRVDKELSDSEFNELWQHITNMFKKYGFDVASHDNLKAADPLLNQRLESLGKSLQEEMFIRNEDMEAMRQGLNYIRGATAEVKEIGTVTGENAKIIKEGVKDMIDMTNTKIAKIHAKAINKDVKVTKDDRKYIKEEPRDLKEDMRVTRDNTKYIQVAKDIEEDLRVAGDVVESLAETFESSNDMYDTLNEIGEQNVLSDNDRDNICLNKGMKKIGAGGYGTVYSYTNKHTGFEIAVKRVDLGFPNDKLKKQVYALKQEIEILRRLKHKNIVRYYEMLEDKNSVSLLMEYVKGGTISDLISKQGALNEKEISDYCQQILQGLAYLHGNKIAHRDIKCANILVDNYICKLADFGLSKENIRSMSGCKTDCGTTYWQSPESIRGQDYGYKSDIWSFGCTVLEMLNTEPPYRELNRYAALMKIANEGLNPSFPPNTSNHCVEFITLCVQKEPQDRPSAKNLLDYKFISKYSES